MPATRIPRLGGALVVATFALTACAVADPPPAAAPPAEPHDLVAVTCPDTIRIATGDVPGPTTGHLYALLGPDAEIAADGLSVTGSLVTDGLATGVDVSILVGSSDQPRPVQMLHDDRSIFLGAVDADEIAADHDATRVVGLYAPFTAGVDAVRTASGAPAPRDAVTEPQIPGIVAVLPDNVEHYVPCFEALVPMLQRAAADYDAQPAEVDALMNEVAVATGAGPLTEEQLAAAHATIAELGLRGDGDVNAARVAEMLGALGSDVDPARIFSGGYLD
jgi:hypothetical protein